MSKERESETALPERWSAKAKSDEGETPLDIARRKKRGWIVDLLVQHESRPQP